MSAYLIHGAKIYDLSLRRWIQKDIAIVDGFFCDTDLLYKGGSSNCRVIEAHDKILLPGAVDIHNDEIERFIAPKRESFFCEHDILDKMLLNFHANGITTAALALTYSLEPGIRNASNTHRILKMIKEYKKNNPFSSTIMVNLRLEKTANWCDILHLIDEFRFEITMVTFSDHAPGNPQNWSTEKYRRYIMQRCKITDYEFNMLVKKMGENRQKNNGLLHDLCIELRSRNILLGIHDLSIKEEDSADSDFGEFPTTFAVIDYLHNEGKPVVMGTPNIRNGYSINNNVSATDACKLGKCNILCSDYDMNSMLRSIGILHTALDEHYYEYYKCISENPAKLLRLRKGIIAPGYSADCILIDNDISNPHVTKTFIGGKLAYESCY